MEYLLDQDRIRAFKKAISKTVRGNDKVINCGCRSGILSIFASKEGGRVLSVDPDKNNIKSTINTIRLNGFIGDVLQNNLLKIKETDFDVVICDQTDTLLLDKQSKIINHLIKIKAITEKTKIIPNKATNFFEIVSYNYDFEGCILPKIIVQSSNHDRVEMLSGAKIINIVEFNKPIQPQTSYEGKQLIIKAGWANAIKFTTVLNLTDDLFRGPTISLNEPIYYPIQSTYVNPGEIISCKINFTMGKGIESLTVKI